MRNRVMKKYYPNRFLDKVTYAKYGVRINSVNPVGTTTPMVAESYEYVKFRREAAIKGPVHGRAEADLMLEWEATAEEQAASILFLASDDATHMTGATVQTDGGWTSF